MPKNGETRCDTEVVFLYSNLEIPSRLAYAREMKLPASPPGLILFLLLALLSNSAFALRLNDRIECQSLHNRREFYGLNAEIHSEVAVGQRGQIMGGAVTFDGFTWWYIKWDDGVYAFSAEGNNRLVAIVPLTPVTIGVGSISSPGPTLSDLTPSFEWTEDSEATAYNIFFRRLPGGVLQSSGFVTGTSWTIPERVIEEGAEYVWNMTAINGTGEGPVSESRYFRTPSAGSSPNAPESLKATFLSGVVELTWEDRSSNENGFLIQRRLNTENWLEISETGSNITAYSNTSIPLGVTLKYRIQAFNEFGQSIFIESETITTSLNPRITGTSPSPLNQAVSKRWITISGFDFKENLNVSFSPNANRRWLNQSDIRLVSSSEIQIHVSTGEVSGDWFIVVKNAASVESQPYTLRVVTPATLHPEPASTTPVASPPSPEITNPDPLKKGIIVIIHGMSASVAGKWPEVMRNAVKDRLIGTRLSDKWKVIAYDWSEAADIGFISKLLLHAPKEKIRSNAKNLGMALGQDLLRGNYSNVHFIAHSTGAWVAEYASAELPSETWVHTTFLDAWTPKSSHLQTVQLGANPFQGEYLLGEHSDFSEHYVTRGFHVGTFKTDSILTCSQNYDLSSLVDPSFPTPIHPALGHEYPHQWYLDTIWDTSEIQGFANSPVFKRGSYTAKGKIINLSSNEIYEPQVIKRFELGKGPIALSEASNSYVGAGSVLFAGNTMTLTSSSPAWVTVDITQETTINFLKMNIEFLGGGGDQDVIGVFWDGEKVATLTSLREQRALSHTILLPETSSIESHQISIRLDSPTNTSRSVRISDIETGYSGTALIPESLKIEMQQNEKITLSCFTHRGVLYTPQSSANTILWEDLSGVKRGNAAVQDFEILRSVAQKKAFYRMKVNEIEE